MPEVEHPAVAVAVVEPAAVERVPEPSATALAHHEVDAQRLERRDLARVDMRGEGRCGLAVRRVRLIARLGRVHDAPFVRS